MDEHCLICERSSLIQKKENPFFVAELETGYVVLGDHQFFEGNTLFLCKYHTFELHDLEPHVKEKFLHEMSMTAEAVFRASSPDKLNYELLGNSDPHYICIFSHDSEMNWREINLYGFIDTSVRNADEHRLSEEERNYLKEKLQVELKKLHVI